MERRLGKLVKLIPYEGLKWYNPVNRWYYYENILIRIWWVFSKIDLCIFVKTFQMSTPFPGMDPYLEGYL